MIVRSPEEIDLANAGDLRTQLASLLRDGSTAVIVDMSDTRFCSSSGFSALLYAYARRPAGSTLCIAARTSMLVRTSTMIGLDQVVPCYATVDEAVSAQSAEVGEPEMGRPTPAGMS